MAGIQVFNNNNSEVLLGAKIHRPDAPLASLPIMLIIMVAYYTDGFV